MATIDLQEAQGRFTKSLLAVFQDQKAPSSFLRSFFTVKESNALNLSIEVRRHGEKVALDVQRGTRGNRNTFALSNEKIFQPPYFREYFSATELDFYDRLFLTGGKGTSFDPMTLKEFIDETMMKLNILKDKIDRAYELQAASVFDTGKVPLINGDEIDFKRKAGSMVDLTGGSYWTDSIDPFPSIIAGGNFLRTDGKSGGKVINMICGDGAIEALLANTIFKERADIKDYELALIREPQQNAVGGVLHGRFSAGPYKINLWSYPEYYEKEGGVSTRIWPTEKVLMLPEVTSFIHGFAGIPTLMTTGNSTFQRAIGSTKGQYVIGDYVDDRATTHEFDIKSAGLMIPVAVDQIYTIQAIA